MLCWLYPQNRDGPIFNYKASGQWGVHMWVVSGKLFVRFRKRNYQSTPHLITSKSLAVDQWQYVGASYDHNTGIASLWLDGKQVVQKNIGTGMTLSTQDNVRMGAKGGDGRYFKGRISAMQIYDVALTEEQVNAVKNAGLGNYCEAALPYHRASPMSVIDLNFANLCFFVALMFWQLNLRSM